VKSGGKVSLVIEPSFSLNEFVDYPNEVSKLFSEAGFREVGKVYLPRRSGESGARTNQTVSEMRGIKVLSSDCRELLTFQKA